MTLQKVARDSLTYGVAGGLGAAATAVGMLVITREITPAEFGWLTLCITLVTLVGSFGTLGVSNGIQYYFLGRSEATDQERRTAVASGVFVALLGVVLALLIVAGLTFAAREVRQSTPPSAMLLVGALAFAWSMGQVLQDLRRLHFQVWKFTATAAVRAVVGTTLGVLAVTIWSQGPIGYLGGLLVGALIALALSLWFARRDLRVAPSYRWGRRVVSYSWPLALAGGAAWVGSSANLWVLQWEGGIGEVGIYGLALRFGGVISLLVASVSQAWSPRVLHSWAHDDGFGLLIHRFSLAWSGLLLAALFCSIPVSVWVIYHVSGSGFAASAQLIPIVMLTFCAQGLVTFTAIGLTFARRTRTIALLAWGSGLLSLAFAFVLAPVMQAVGVAVAALVGQLVLVVLYAARSKGSLTVQVPYGRIAAQWVCALALCAVASILLANSGSSAEGPVALLCFVSAVAFAVLVLWELKRTQTTGVDPAPLRAETGAK